MYFIIIIVIMVLSSLASGKVQRVFEEHASTPLSCGYSGAQIANILINRYGNAPVDIRSCSGTLTDHYDPRDQSVNLSQGVYNACSVSAAAVTAHELGHVMQYQSGFGLISLRSAILPVANFASQFSTWIIFGGLALNMLNLAWIGVFLYGAIFLFQLLTLPVELNASKRALTMLTECGLLTPAEEPGAKAMLRAAAMTYFWATIASLASLLRMVAVVAGRDQRRRR